MAQFAAKLRVRYAQRRIRKAADRSINTATTATAAQEVLGAAEPRPRSVRE